VVFFNAMAANDPQSTAQLYRELVSRRPATPAEGRCIVVNTRQDRPARTRQMAELVVTLDADHVYVVGSGAHHFRDQALDHGCPAGRLTLLDGAAPDMAERLLDRAQPRLVVFAMGNIAGPGLALADELERRAAAGARVDVVEPLPVDARVAA
jgi:hypothetical protein